jgi:tetratricopeptide (TPR) repeat protein
MRRAAAALLLAAAACAPRATAARSPERPAAPALAETPRENARRSALLKRLGDASAFNDLLRADDLDGPLLAGVALEAYAQGEELKAVLFAQAALGADVGNGTRRRLLHVLAAETGIPFDPEGVLPPSGLVQHELARAETAFFDRRFGAAAQSCRRALLVAPENAAAWTRLGSSYYALGDEKRARQAYAKARALEPGDESLARFMSERGWAAPEPAQ